MKTTNLTFRDLTEEEISSLSVPMRCCYAIQPWNISMTGNTVEQWAKQIGRARYDITDEEFPIARAIREACKLITSTYKFIASQS